MLICSSKSGFSAHILVQNPFGLNKTVFIAVMKLAFCCMDWLNSPISSSPLNKHFAICIFGHIFSSNDGLILPSSWHYCTFVVMWLSCFQIQKKGPQIRRVLTTYPDKDSCVPSPHRHSYPGRYYYHIYQFSHSYEGLWHTHNYFLLVSGMCGLIYMLLCYHHHTDEVHLQYRFTPLI